MLVSLKWLREYVDVNVPVEEFVSRMIMTGLEVEEYKEQGGNIKGVITGKITDMQPHPDADRLRVCSIDVGDKVLQIVTGAPNVNTGDIVPVAVDGAVLPGGTIKRVKMRGVVSEGMLCSGEELGIGEEDYPGAGVYGVIILPADTPLGEDIRKTVGMDDVYIDFKSYANRPDCMGMLGIAREAAVTLGVPLRLPEIKVPAGSGDINRDIAVAVKDDDLCPRYVARAFKNIKIEPSPAWMQARLKAAGTRPINNVVDITNYVMLEMGQPLHAFDRREIRGGRITVRRAAEGETLVTLDGKERVLGPSNLVIADDEGAVALAGIMGGEDSGIKDDTSAIILESANFMGGNIRQTSRSLGLRTEASARYEKNNDPELCRLAADRAAQLFAELGAGEIVEGVIDIYTHIPERKVITTSCGRIRRHLGMELPDGEMLRILTDLGFETTLEDGTISAKIPSRRQDVEGFADLAEEIVRIYGFDKIPFEVPEENMAGYRTEKQKQIYRLKDLMVGYGFDQIETYSFMSPKAFDKLRIPEDDSRRMAARLLKPLGEDYSLMRTTMLPSLLETVERNANQRIDSFRIFESGRVYLPKALPLEELPEEKNMLSAAIYGSDDFFEIKGIIEGIASEFNLPRLIWQKETDAAYHPGAAAKIICRGKTVGHAGRLHPEVLRAWGIAGEKLLVAEIDVDTLLSVSGGAKLFRGLPRYPAVSRDLALVMDDGEPVGNVMDTISSAAGALLEEIKLFDIYRSPTLGLNKKSVAFSLVFRAEDRTLEDSDITAVTDKILKAVQKRHGAVLR